MGEQARDPTNSGDGSAGSEAEDTERRERADGAGIAGDGDPDNGCENDKEKFERGDESCDLGSKPGWFKDDRVLYPTGSFFWASLAARSTSMAFSFSSSEAAESWLMDC